MTSSWVRRQPRGGPISRFAPGRTICESIQCLSVRSLRSLQTAALQPLHLPSSGFCMLAGVHNLSILLNTLADRVFVHRNGKAPQIPPADTGTPSMSTFFSDSPDSPMDLDMSSTIRDCGRDLGGFTNRREERGPAAARQVPSASAPDDEIAPWMSTVPSTFNGVAHNGSFFDDRPTNTRNHAATRPDTRASDSFDPMFHSDDRRPSMASLTTVSSQNSAPISRTNTNLGAQHRRLGAFFGDDGRDSSMGSDTGILTPGRDHSTSSQSRKARHNSVQTNNTDGRRTSSPSSSRPRSPQPSSDVTPWLFQDFKVSARDLVCSMYHPSHACLPNNGIVWVPFGPVEIELSLFPRHPVTSTFTRRRLVAT